MMSGMACAKAAQLNKASRCNDLHLLKTVELNLLFSGPMHWTDMVIE